MFKLHNIITDPIPIEKVSFFDDQDYEWGTVCAEALVEDEEGMSKQYITFDTEDEAFRFIKRYKSYSTRHIEPLDLDVEGDVFPEDP